MLAFRRLLRPRPARPAPRARLCLEGLEERAVPSSTSVISSNFNGTAIPAGDTVWFSSVVKVSGVGPSGATLHLSNAEVDFTSKAGAAYALSVPNAALTFSPTATQATTNFDPSTNTWDTTVPVGLGGNTFLSGFGLLLPNGLPGGTNPVTWKGTFTSDTGGLSVNWQWAAAAYTQFGSDPNALNVKPVDSNQASVYQNSDHAGTPEVYKAFVTGGARGGGGSNWTGSYSATATVLPGPYVPPSGGGVAAAAANSNPPSSLSGSVVDTSGNPLSGVVVTLTTTDSQGNTVTVGTFTTDSSGNFSFTGLAAGTYTITEAPPVGYFDTTNVVGSAGGATTANQFSVALGGGVSGTGYEFVDDVLPLIPA